MSSDHRKRNPVAGREPGLSRGRGWVWGGARFPGRRRLDSRAAPAESRRRPDSRRAGRPGAALTLAGDRPVLPPGIRWAIPLGAAAHLLGGLLFLHQAVGFREDRLPDPAAHRVRLASLAPAASLLGNSPAPARSPEPSPAGAATPPIRRPPTPSVLALLEELAELPTTTISFGAGASGAETLPGASPFPGSGALGRPEGVLGGLPGGVPGGSIHGLRDRGDPVLPPPDEPPAPIAMPRPRFPEAALRDGVRGRVVLRALITARGTVEVLRILRSVPALDREAIRVVESEWRFRPARRNGRPTPALSDLSVRFTLR